DLGYLNINCENPNGSVSVSVSPGGQTVTLLDDGLGSDQAAGDGIYSGQWTASSPGTFTLTFPGGDTVPVIVGLLNSITPNPVDLASPPASFTITGGGFANLGFGRSVANFTRNGTLIAQARATSGNSTTLTVPFPTTQGLFGTLPGLSAGPATVEVYNQTGSSSWSLVGSTSLTVNDTRPAPGVSSITPSSDDRPAAPERYTITGGDFAKLSSARSAHTSTRNVT